MTHRRDLLHAAAALGALALAGCILSYPQRLPGPLVVPGPERATTPAGTARITVQRDSGPVWIRQPGERGEVEVPFYAKRERVPVGALVRTGAGGRAELLWTPDASSFALFDEGRATLGDPDRDEPFLRLHSVTRAILVLTPEDRVELPNGARLVGDPLEPTGPILLEGLRPALLRVINQSKRTALIAFRHEEITLGPGESLDLPTPPGGGAPAADEPEPTHFEAHGIPIAYRGELERPEDAAGVSLVAREECLVRALGVELRLPAGETARFTGLSPAPGGPPADPETRP